MDNYLSCHITETRPENSWRWEIGSIVGWLTTLVLLLLFVFPFPTIAAVTIPDPEPGLYVLDQAGVMSNETKNMIINTSQELARQTKAQVAVVTLKTIDEQPIADVALGIGRKWQLGDKQLNNGVVILVVPTEKKVRIEVGYGLEGALPDGKIGRLEDEYMLPAFKQGNYDLGLANGYKAVVTEVAKEYGVSIGIQQGGKTVPVEAPAKKKVPTWLTILGVIGIIILIWLDNRFLNGFFFGMLLGMLLRGGGGRGGGGDGDSGGGGSFGGGGSDRNW